MSEKAPIIESIPPEVRAITGLLEGVRTDIEPLPGMDSSQVFPSAENTYLTGFTREPGSESCDDRNLLATSYKPEKGSAQNKNTSETGKVGQMVIGLDEERSILDKLTGRKPHIVITDASHSFDHDHRGDGIDDRSVIERNAKISTTLDGNGNVLKRDFSAGAHKTSDYMGRGGRIHQEYIHKFTGTPEEQAAKRERYARLLMSLAAKKVERARKPGGPIIRYKEKPF